MGLDGDEEEEDAVPLVHSASAPQLGHASPRKSKSGRLTSWDDTLSLVRELLRTATRGSQSSSYPLHAAHYAYYYITHY